jgi:hypothetical protein
MGEPLKQNAPTTHPSRLPRPHAGPHCVASQNTHAGSTPNVPIRRADGGGLRHVPSAHGSVPPRAPGAPPPRRQQRCVCILLHVLRCLRFQSFARVPIFWTFVSVPSSAWLAHAHPSPYSPHSHLARADDGAEPGRHHGVLRAHVLVWGGAGDRPEVRRLGHLPEDAPLTYGRWVCIMLHLIKSSCLVSCLVER